MTHLFWTKDWKVSLITYLAAIGLIVLDWWLYL